MIRRAFCRFSGPLFFTLAVASLLLPGTVSYAQSTAKKVVKTEDDLPRFNYAIPRHGDRAADSPTMRRSTSLPPRCRPMWTPS